MSNLLESIRAVGELDLDLTQVQEQVNETDLEQYNIDRDPFEHCPVDCFVVLANDYQLQLDLDTEESYLYFMQELRKLEKDCDWHFKLHVSPSKSGLPKRHATLTSKKPMPIWQRIALQAVLGSDPMRELLNAKRVLLDDPFPVAFFEQLKR